MKLRFVLIAVLSLLFSAQAMAQTAAEVRATQKKMEAASAPCNQGPEAFRDFIQKFSTDQEFMQSRMKLTPSECEIYADILVPESFKAMEPFAKDDDEFYQSWGEIQYGRVYLECGWVDSYCTHTFEFVRDGGKWYLGKIVPGE